MTPDLLIEIDSATQAYFAKAQSLTLTAIDFYDWLASLPPARRNEVRLYGLLATHAETEFFRFCLEGRGIDLWRFMAASLSLPAFNLWAATSPQVGSRLFDRGY